MPMKFYLALSAGLVFLLGQTLAATLLPTYPTFAAQKAAPKYKSFKVSAFTYASVINDDGVVAGGYEPAKGGSLGFVRGRGGKITKIAPKGSANVTVTGINNSGVIVGYDLVPSTISPTGVQIFMRAADGTISALDIVGSRGEPNISINDSGLIAGGCCDATGEAKGFLRTPDGTVTTFRIGSNATYADCINASGMIAGHYILNFVPHPFLRSVNGAITKFSIKGSDGIVITAMNSAGAIVGWYNKKGEHSTEAFERAADGTIATWAIAGSIANAPSAIGDDGTVVGDYFNSDSDTIGHGFLRTSDGTITTFDPPGSTSTIVSGRNGKGAITGFYVPEGGGDVGFIRSQ